MRPSRYDFQEPVCSGGDVWRANWRGVYHQIDQEWNVPLTTPKEGVYSTSGEISDIEYDMHFGGDGNYLFLAVPSRKNRTVWFHSDTNIRNSGVYDHGKDGMSEWVKDTYWTKVLWKRTRRDVLLDDIKAFGGEAMVFWYNRGEVVSTMSLAAILAGIDRAKPYVHVPTPAEMREQLVSQQMNLAAAERHAQEIVEGHTSANRHLRYDKRYKEAVQDLRDIEAATKKKSYWVAADGRAWRDDEWESAKHGYRERAEQFRGRWVEHRAEQEAELKGAQAATKAIENELDELSAQMVSRGVLGVGTAGIGPPPPPLPVAPADPAPVLVPVPPDVEVAVKDEPKADSRLLRGGVSKQRPVIDLTGVEWRFRRNHLWPIDWDPKLCRQLNIWIRPAGTGKVRVLTEGDTELEDAIVDFGDIEATLKRGRQGFYFANITPEQVAEIRQ
jgi:hypothetical protein